MADICAWCGSPDTMAGFDLHQCLTCGLHSTFTGDKALPTSQVNEGVTLADVPNPEPETALEAVPDSGIVPEPVEVQ